MSIIEHVTLQKIVAHDFQYDPRNIASQNTLQHSFENLKYESIKVNFVRILTGVNLVEIFDAFFPRNLKIICEKLSNTLHTSTKPVTPLRRPTHVSVLYNIKTLCKHLVVTSVCILHAVAQKPPDNRYLKCCQKFQESFALTHPEN